MSDSANSLYGVYAAGKHSFSQVYPSFVLIVVCVTVEVATSKMSLYLKPMIIEWAGNW